MSGVVVELELKLHASLDEEADGHDGIHAWLCDMNTERAGLFSQSCSEFEKDQLSVDELARAAQFKSPRERGRFVRSRVTLRALLARQFGVKPDELVFARDALGKPRLLSPTPAIPLHFGCSHSDGFFLIAIGPHELGADLELVRDDFDVLAVAEANFLASEAAQLRSLSGHARTVAFHRLWTAKEAFGKTLGYGVASALENVEFTLDFHGFPQLVNTRGRFAFVRDWQLLQRSVTLGSVQAVVAVTTQSCHENSTCIRRSLPPPLVATHFARC
ncbi:MAG: 4'-phosphopantetheinyl transferase superfamily protein [Verrucomicrobia bacterium]|nr:4'-phosphopantetheinyl transferase superfamily protein [Verrucomicrobiota bacterium]